MLKMHLSTYRKHYVLFFFILLPHIWTLLKDISLVDGQNPDTLKTLNIGVLQPRSSLQPVMNTYFQNDWNGMKFALNEFEPIAKAQGIRFELLGEDYTNHFKDAEEEKNTDFVPLIINTTLTLLKQPLHGMIGPYLSRFSTSLADLSTIHQIPFCFMDPSVPTVLDKKKYPYYFDQSPSGSDFADSFLKIAKTFNWHRFFVLHSTDEFSSSLALSLTQLSLTHPNLDIKVLPFWEREEDSETKIALDILEQSDYRVFLVSAISHALRSVLKELYLRQGFRSNSTFFFLGNVSAGIEMVLTPDQMNDMISENSPVRGIFAIDSSTIPDKLKSYQRFEKNFSKQFPGTPVNSALVGYGCAISLMNGLLKLHSKNTSDSPFHLNEFLNFDWEGPFGKMQYNERGTLITYMSLYNWQNAGLITVSQFQMTAEAPLEIRQPMFASGSRIVPSDVPDDKLLTVDIFSISGMLLACVCAFTALVGFLSICKYMFHANHELIKPASVEHSLLMLIGLEFLLGCIVSQLFLNWEWGCHLTLLLGLVGIGAILGSLLAKHSLILQVYEAPLKMHFGGPSSLPRSSLSSHSPMSSFSGIRGPFVFLWRQLKRFFSFSSGLRGEAESGHGRTEGRMGHASPTARRKGWFSKPNVVALSIIFFHFVLGLIFIFVTPMKWQLHSIGRHCKAHLCLPKQYLMKDQIHFNETATNPIFYLLVVYHVLLILWILWMSWQSQKVTEKKLMFTKNLGITAYVLTFLGSFIFLSWALDELLYPISFWIRGIGLLTLVILLLWLFILPPLVALRQEQKKYALCSIHSTPSPSMLSSSSSSTSSSLSFLKRNREKLKLDTTLPNSTSSPYIYEGRLMYFHLSPLWLRFLSFSLYHGSWKWTHIKVIPEYRWLYFIEMDRWLRYTKVHFNPSSITDLNASNRKKDKTHPTFQQNRKSGFPSSSSLIFQLEVPSPSSSSASSQHNVTSSTFHSFWASNEQATKKWVRILTRQ